MHFDPSSQARLPLIKITYHDTRSTPHARYKLLQSNRSRDKNDDGYLASSDDWIPFHPNVVLECDDLTILTPNGSKVILGKGTFIQSNYGNKLVLCFIFCPSLLRV
jgi:hypothetical protein